MTSAITDVKRPVYQAKLKREPVQCLALALDPTLIYPRCVGERHVYNLEEQVRGQCCQALVGPTARKWRWGNQARWSVRGRGNHGLFVKDDHSNGC